MVEGTGISANVRINDPAGWFGGAGMTGGIWDHDPGSIGVRVTNRIAAQIPGADCYTQMQRPGTKE